MDIKLVRNFEDGKYFSINKDLLVQMIDDNYQIESFRGKKLFILNPATNERYDVMPEIKKYDLVDISYAAAEHDYIMFTSAVRINQSEIKIDYYWYTISNGESQLVYSQNVNIHDLKKTVEIKVIVLDENYCIFETIRYDSNNRMKPSLISKGTASYELILHDIAAQKDHTLSHSMIAESGIDRIVPLNGNMCAIKIGSSMIEEKLYEHYSDQNERKEIIGIVNVKQFISEIALDLDNVYMDILDEGTGVITFPYLKNSSDYIVYSKVDVEKRIEEIIMYDFENKIKKVRLNNKISRVSDLSKTFMIDDVPYMINSVEKNTRMVNLNTQKTEVKLGSDVRIRFVYNDIIVTEKHVGKMFFMRKENNYIEVFRFPDMHHSIFKTRAQYRDCIVHGDDLMIFTN